jgi:hypothetical protein
LALEATHFVGTRGSNWNRLIDELRTVWPAHEIGCCNTYIEVGCLDAGYKDGDLCIECDINGVKDL